MKARKGSTFSGQRSVCVLQIIILSLFKCLLKCQMPWSRILTMPTYLMKKKSMEIELNWFCSCIWAVSPRTIAMYSVSFLETLGDLALDGLQSPHLSLCCFARPTLAPIRSATDKYFAVRTLLIGSSVQCLFQQLQFAFTSEGHAVSLPGCWWNSSTALPLHTIFVG